MASERVKFTRQYDHTWPSRAMTTYPNNWTGLVKAEVARAAVAAGAARRVKLETATAEEGAPAKRKRGRPRTKVVGVKGGKIDQAEPAPTLPRNLPPELAEPQALTPNLHVDSTVDEKDNSQ